MDERLLRRVIREFLEEGDLEEFSSGGVVGGSAPIGDTMHQISMPDDKVTPRKGRRRKKVHEANTTYGGSSGAAIDLNGDGTIDNFETNFFGTRDEMYQSSVEKLARSYGGAESPFKNKGQVKKFLARKI